MGEYGHDADLFLGDRAAFRLEYKWDRYAPRNLAAEVIARDRGADPQLGYIFKQGYDFLVYAYIVHDVIYILEAQSLRKYVFTRRAMAQARFGAAHCWNGNRQMSAAWNALVPVQALYPLLARHGLAFKVHVPHGLLMPEVSVEEAMADPRNDQLLAQFLETLQKLADVPKFQPWVPSESQHWVGMDEFLWEQNQQRKNFKANEVEHSQLHSLPWAQLAKANGWMRD